MKPPFFVKKNEFYLLDLKNKQLDSELQKTLKKNKENNKEKEENMKRNDNNSELEAIIQYLSLIILSKPGQNEKGNDEIVKGLKGVCGENFFKVLEEIYLKINDYEVENNSLKENVKEQVIIYMKFLFFIFNL